MSSSWVAVRASYARARTAGGDLDAEARAGGRGAGWRIVARARLVERERARLTLGSATGDVLVGRTRGQVATTARDRAWSRVLRKRIVSADPAHAWLTAGPESAFLAMVACEGRR